MDPCELSMSVAALANSIACNLNDEDLELLAVVLAQLGDTLATIAVRRTQCNKKNLS